MHVAASVIKFEMDEALILGSCLQEDTVVYKKLLDSKQDKSKKCLSLGHNTEPKLLGYLLDYLLHEMNAIVFFPVFFTNYSFTF